MKSSLYPRHNKFYFKKFSRKTYAVFCSLRKVIHISNLTIVYTLIVAAGKLNAQSDTVAPMKLIDLEQVEVVSDQGSAVSEEFVPPSDREVLLSLHPCADDIPDE